MADLGVQLPSRIRMVSSPDTVQSPSFCSVPWLVSLATVLVANYVMRGAADPLVQALALGSIVAGPISFVVTRYTADEMMAGSRNRIFPVAIVAFLLTGVISAVLGALFFGLLVDGDLLSRGVAIVLQVYVSMNFVALGFPAVFRKVRGPAVVLIAGFGLSLVAGKFGGDLLHTTGMLLGFTVGQIVLFALLLQLIRLEFGKGDGSLASGEILKQLRTHRSLALCGLALAVGIWMDKLIPLPIAPNWEVTSLALMSTIPGIAFFFLHLRTDFTPALQVFKEGVRNGGTLESIRSVKASMTRAFRSGFVQLIAVQAVITCILIYYSSMIGAAAGFAALETAMFRVALVGAFLLVIFSAMLSLLLYLRDSRGAALATCAFALIATVLTVLTVVVFPIWNGFGFVIASGVAMLIAVFRVNYRLDRLEFDSTSAGQ